MGEQVAAGLYGGVAQLGEHLPCKQGVKGSNPFISTKAILSSERERQNRRFSSAASIMKNRFSQSTPYLENYTLEKTSDIEMI